jgi:membrane-associated phospholipid phosphatase
MKILELFFRDMTSLGGMFLYGLWVIGLGLLGHIDLAKKLFLAFVIVTIITVLIRCVYFKERPKKQAHSSFLERIDASSFPSIHAARSVSLALIVGKSVQAPLFFAFVLIVAFIVCLSRYYLKKHDTTDIIAGIILGAIVGFLL